MQDIDGGYVKVKKIDYQNNFNFIKQQNYEFTVTSGDILTIIIWGQQEVFLSLHPLTIIHKIPDRYQMMGKFSSHMLARYL